MFIIRILAILCFTASVWADPGFHIKNKSNATIYVDVHDAGILSKMKSFFVTEANTVRSGQMKGVEIDTKDGMIIKIYENKDKLLCKVKIPKHKTAYINWDGTKLYPQRGALWGRLGQITGDPKTTEGYSLKNNVTAKKLECKKE